MSSEASTDALAKRRARARLRRRVRAVGPWVIWSLALVLAGYLGRDIVGVSGAPAVAEVRQVTLSAPRAARVKRVVVRAGQQVAAGDLLVELDPAEIDLELQVARQVLEKLSLEIPAQKGALAATQQRELERRAGDAEQAAVEVARLEADEHRDRGELATLDEQIARQRDLVAKKLAASTTLDSLVLKRAALSRKVEGYKKLLAKARAHAKAAGARLYGESSASIDARIAPFVAAVRAQKERIATLESVRAAYAITAPSAGAVADVLVQPGDSAAQGAALLTLVDDHPTRVIAYVEERWARKVRLGDRARLTPSDRMGKTRLGEVVALGPTIAQAPERFWTIPGQPQFARKVFLALRDDDAEPPLPGQAFDAVFLRQERQP